MNCKIFLILLLEHSNFNLSKIKNSKMIIQIWIIKRFRGQKKKKKKKKKKLKNFFIKKKKNKKMMTIYELLIIIFILNLSMYY